MCLLLKNIDWKRSSRTSIICYLFDSSFHPPFCTNIIWVIFQLHLYHTTILNRHGDPNGKETQKTRISVTNLFKVLKYLPHQGMFFPPANSGGLLFHLFSCPPAPGTFHQMCCNKGVIFTLAVLWKLNWIFFPFFVFTWTEQRSRWARWWWCWARASSSWWSSQNSCCSKVRTNHQEVKIVV